MVSIPFKREGKCRQTVETEEQLPTSPKVSIPFKREGKCRQVVAFQNATLATRFQFPSNGKVNADP